jgi:hypothetical protein
MICFLAAFHPNCVHCCTQSFGCKCTWAWESCPQEGCFSGCKRSWGATPGDLGAGDSGSFELPRVELDADVAPQSTGGTLAFVQGKDGTFVVASVADADMVHVVRLEATEWSEAPFTVRTFGDVTLDRWSDPGRVTADAAGHAHVALRRSGEIVTIDPQTMSVVRRKRVCAGPRGMAFDAATDTIHVACVSGDVVTLSASDGAETRRVFVERGLEDVAVFGEKLLVNDGVRLFVIDADGSVVRHRASGRVGPSRTSSGAAAVALSKDNTALAAVTPEGTVGPSIVVSATPMFVSDMAVSSDGTVAIAAGGDAFLLAPGASRFAPIGGAGTTTAVAFGAIEGSGVLALQTTKPSMLLFLGAAGPNEVAAVEPLQR